MRFTLALLGSVATINAAEIPRRSPEDQDFDVGGGGSGVNSRMNALSKPTRKLSNAWNTKPRWSKPAWSAPAWNGWSKPSGWNNWGPPPTKKPTNHPVDSWWGSSWGGEGASVDWVLNGWSEDGWGNNDAWASSPTTSSPTKAPTSQPVVTPTTPSPSLEPSSSEYPPCYIGLKFLEELTKDPSSARCCDMPPSYYGLLASNPESAQLVPALKANGCKNVDFPPTSPPERPVCYETAFQISLWLFWTKFFPDGFTDYPVCDGTVIRPGLLTPSGGFNLPSVVAGIIDSPLVVSIPDLNLYCEGDDHGCAFDGGEYQVLSLPKLENFTNLATGAPDTLVDDTSNLKIEGFTFTGEMKSVNDDNRFTYSIYLAAAGKNMSIVNNIFADVTGPVDEEISTSGKCRSQGYYALAANPSVIVDFEDNIGILEIHVSMEDNDFHNIDVGSYPVYAPEDPKKCSFCYYETNETVAFTSIIYNVGQNVTLKRNTFEDIIAERIYKALPPGFFLAKYEDANITEVELEAKYGCPPSEGKPCFAAVIKDNTFKKNAVRSLVYLSDSKNKTSTVTLSNNEGECDQTYTGGKYCPLLFRVSTFEVGSVVQAVDVGEPFENCAGQPQFCFSEKRVTDLDPRSAVCEELND